MIVNNRVNWQLYVTFDIRTPTVICPLGTKATRNDDNHLACVRSLCSFHIIIFASVCVCVCTCVSDIRHYLSLFSFSIKNFLRLCSHWLCAINHEYAFHIFLWSRNDHKICKNFHSLEYPRSFYWTVAVTKHVKIINSRIH